MTDVDEAAIAAAFKKRHGYFKEIFSTVTMKSLRATLEEDLGLATGTLKPHKKFLGELFNDFANAQDNNEEEEAPSPESAKKKKKSDKSKQKKRKSGGSTDDDEPAPKKQPRQYSKKVEKLKSICKQATITIPPVMYTKNKEEADLIRALNDLLEKNGLNADSGAHEIAKVKQKLQIERDLDGIDPNAIIQGGRRSRRADAAPISYRSMIKVPKEAIDDEEESSREEEEEASDAEPEVSVHSEEGNGGDEEEEEASEEKEQKEEVEEKPASVQKKSNQSPNENKVGNISPAAAKAEKPASKVGTSPKTAKQRTVVADWSDDE